MTYHELCRDIAFADECRDLGFEMDCGQSFAGAFPGTRALNDWQDLRNVIESINDTYLLGSAIFSQWRYFNHWAGPGESMTSEENRQFNWWRGLIYFDGLSSLLGDNKMWNNSKL